MKFAPAAALLFGFGVVLVPPSGCGTGECEGLVCDYTHITLLFVDAEDEPADATRVTYTRNPYNDEGELLTAEELEEAGIDITEVHEATCTARDESTGECPTWVITDGFGVYTITAVLEDDDGVVEATETLDVDLTVPTSGKDKACCGLVHAEEQTVTLDPEADTAE